MTYSPSLEFPIGNSVQETGTPASSTTKAPTLQVGETYIAKISEKPSEDLNKNGVNLKGVLLQGQFVEMELPPDAELGQEIEVQVTQVEPKLKLALVEESKANSTKISDEQRKLQANILNVVKSLESAKKELLGLKLNTAQGRILNSLEENSLLNLDQFQGDQSKILNFLGAQASSTTPEAVKNLLQIKNSFTRNLSWQSSAQTLKSLLINDNTGINSELNTEKILNSITIQEQQLIEISKKVELLNQDGTTPFKLAIKSLKELNRLSTKSDVSKEVQALVKQLNQLLTQESAATDSNLIKQALHTAEQLVKHSSVGDALRTSSLAIRAHLTSALVQQEETNKIQNDLLTLTEELSSKQQKINPELIKSLTYLANGSTKASSNVATKAIFDYLAREARVQVNPTSVLETLARIENGDSISVIKQELNKLLELTSNSNDTILKEVHKFAKISLEELAKIELLPILKRAEQLNDFLIKVNGLALSNLDEINKQLKEFNHEILKLDKISNVLKSLIAQTQNAITELKDNHQLAFTAEETKELASDTSKFGKLLANYKELGNILKSVPDATINNNKLNQIIKDFEQHLNKGITPVQLKSFLERAEHELTQFRTNNNQDLETFIKSSKLGMIEQSLQKLFSTTTPLTTKEKTPLAHEHIDELLTNLLQKLGDNESNQTNNNSQLERSINILSTILKNDWSVQSSHNNSNQSDIKQLIQLFAKLQKTNSSDLGPLEQSILETVNKFNEELVQAEHLDPQKQKALISKITKAIKNDLLELPQQTQRLQDNPIFKAIQGLETLYRGQEAVQQMAPLLQSAGDPIFMIFPMILQGFLSKVELTHYQPKYARKELVGDEESNNKSNSEQFKQTTLNFNLENLGAISAQLTHSKNEVYCTFQFERQEVADYISLKMPLLETAFARLGYLTVACKSEKMKRMQNPPMAFGTSSKPVISIV